MSLVIYNSLTRKKEEFKPLQPGRVHIYVCGPTVYGHPHVGHAKSYISFELPVRIWIVPVRFDPSHERLFRAAACQVLVGASYLIPRER